jgi:hypothetical protein
MTQPIRDRARAILAAQMAHTRAGQIEQSGPPFTAVTFCSCGLAYLAAGVIPARVRARADNLWAVHQMSDDVADLADDGS